MRLGCFAADATQCLREKNAGGDNESGPRTGKRKRAGRMQARCSPDRRDAGGGSRCKGGAARRTAKRKPATGGGELEAGREGERSEGGLLHQQNRTVQNRDGGDDFPFLIEQGDA